MNAWLDFQWSCFGVKDSPSLTRKVGNLVFCILSILTPCHLLMAANYTVSPGDNGYTVVGDDATGGFFEDTLAFNAINWAIEQAGQNGGGNVYLSAGNYEIAGFDLITGEYSVAGAIRQWVSAREDVTVSNDIQGSSPPYQAQGSYVTKISITESPEEPPPGLIAYVNFEVPIDLSGYRALSMWLATNKQIYAGSVTRLQLTFSHYVDGKNPFRKIQVWHSEDAVGAWRGYRFPALGSDGQYLDHYSLPKLAAIKSIGIEIVPDPGNRLPLGATETVFYIDNLSGHYGQIMMVHDDVRLQGEGPYHTILKLKDYGNLPVIYLSGKRAEVSQMQIQGNAENCTLIDKCYGIDVVAGNLAGTSIHHNYIQQTQGSSIVVRGSGLEIFQNLLTTSENPMVSVINSAQNDIYSNTLKYCTQDAFVYVKYANAVNNMVRNNTFWPISAQALVSGSPYFPEYYADHERFRAIIRRGIHVYEHASDNSINENVFYNMKTADFKQQAILLSGGANNILVQENQFNSSNMDVRRWGYDPYQSRFVNNVFVNGQFTVYGGYGNEFLGNVFTERSVLSLLQSSYGNTGSGNYFDSTSSLNDASSGSSIGTTAEKPPIPPVNAGVDWEWGIVKDGGFEYGDGSLPDAWVTSGDARYTTHSWVQGGEHGVHGIRAGRTVVDGLDVNSADAHSAGWAMVEYAAVTPGEVLRAEAILRLDNYQGFGNGLMREGLWFGAIFSSDAGAECNCNSEKTVGLLTADQSWTEVSGDIKVPPGCTRVKLSVQLADANGDFTVDEVKLSRKMTAIEVGQDASVVDSSNGCSTDWIDDDVPTGAVQGGNWQFVSTDPAPFSGASAHRSGGASNILQHYYYNATDAQIVNAGDTLFTYVYLDPANPPEEIMLQWYSEGGLWEHRAYWGANRIKWGTDGTASRFYAGSLPTPGGWVRLKVPASAVGLEGAIVTGMAFTQYRGQVTWDRAGKSPNSSFTVWVDDTVPAGARQAGTWNFVNANPTPFSGAFAHQSDLVTGFNQHFFYNASDSLSIGAGDTLFAYVFLDPSNPPSELMLQWYEGGSWQHRAYWGDNIINYGTDGTASRMYMGSLPAAGRWVRLVVPASEVGLEGLNVKGMAFSHYGGRVTWDRAGKSPNSSFTVWVDDTVPAGARQAGTWNFVNANPTPFSGAFAHQSDLVTGFNQHFFYNASDSLSIGAGDTLFAYVFLDPSNPPSELMLQWYEGGSWQHRAYWGDNIINYGTDGTASRMYMGSLPAAGRWVRLVVPASEVGLEGLNVKGMAFSHYGGRVTWDYAGRM